MPVTPTYAFPYPALSDPPNGPAQFQALATAVENQLVTTNNSATALASRVTTLESNLTNIPIANLRQTVAQSIPNAVFTAIIWGTADIDTATGWSSGTNPERYTAKKTGKYLIAGSAATTFPAVDGFRATVWFKNGVSVAGTQIDSTARVGVAWPIPARTIALTLAVNDYIELRLYQDSGGAALNTSVASDVQSSLTVTFLSV